MDNTGYIALSRQDVLRRNLSVVANNLANMNTTAFKAHRTLFVEYVNGPDQPGPKRDKMVSMSFDQGVMRDLKPGPTERTGAPLDIALDGNGYLVVDSESGPRFTRNGRLQLGADGTLVDTNGLPVLSTFDQPIQIGEALDRVTITETGDILIDDAVIAQLKLVQFDNELDINNLGSGLYVTNQDPRPAVGLTVVQGAVEGSNVSPIREMTRMTEVLREYQSIQRLIQSEHDRQRDAYRKLSGNS